VLHTDAAFAAAVEKAVGEIEGKTDSEVVVVAAARSGTYRDISLVVGGAVAWLALVFVIFSPFHFSGSWLPFELPVIVAVAGWLADKSPALIRRLAGRRRLGHQVMQAAHAAFHEEALSGTPRRNAVLVYVSTLEQQVVLVPDAGLEAVMPPAELNTVRFGKQQDPHAPGELQEFLAGLTALGERLARYAPPTGAAKANAISDAPRIRS
jgi:uncharacterized membrane protein